MGRGIVACEGSAERHYEKALECSHHIYIRSISIFPSMLNFDIVTCIGIGKVPMATLLIDIRGCSNQLL